MADDQEIKEKRQVDIFRETPIRYLGYANEVGEAFRSQVHVNWVRASYGVASLYVCADAADKGKQANQFGWPSENIRRLKVCQAVVDTVIWQGLASVAIPGFTINRICWASNLLLQRAAANSMPGPMRKWTVTLIGLGSIPLIIKPIDNLVDHLLEATLRTWFRMDPVLEEGVVHHKRDD